jgi:Raf kinase inhibitor-like YbhB/YbcL family protein
MSILYRCRRVPTALAVLMIGAIAVGSGQSAHAQGKAKGAPAHFRVTAPDLVSKGRITISHVFNGMGCNGQNISPALEWANPPVGTKSFAVTMYDPDAPTGSGWWHWVMYNIPAGTTGLVAGAGGGRNAPRVSAQGRTDLGSKGYGGPCPPVGDKPHHYTIPDFALKVDKIDVPGDATAAYVGFNLNANKLATARVTGLYGR